MLRRVTASGAFISLSLSIIFPRQFSTRAASKPFSQFSLKRRPKAIQESQEILTEYLHITRSLPYVYAGHIAMNSPRSLSEVVSKVPSSPSTSFARSLQRFLRYHPINELEFFLESIGISGGDNGIPSSVLPPHTYFISDWKHFNVACVLAKLGFPWNKLGMFCKDHCLVFETDPSELQRKFTEIKDGYGFNSVWLISICMAFPQVLYDKMDDLLSDLKILILDHDLSTSIDDNVDAVFEVCEKIRLFYELGFEKGKVCVLMDQCKSIFIEHSKETLVSKTDYFCKLNIPKDQIGLLLLLRPEIFHFIMEDRVISVSEFLKQLGLGNNDLKSLEQRYPHVFGRNKIANLPVVMRSMDLDEWFFERLRNGGHTLLDSYTICHPEEDLDKHYADNLRKLQAKRTYGHSVKKLNFLHSIGFGENKYAVKALAKMSGNSEELKQRFDCLLRHVIEYSKLCGMVARSSGKILNQQENVIERKIEYLCTEMGSSVQYLDTFPGYLCFDLEKRIMPRYRLYKWLVEQGFCRKEYAIATIIAGSEKEFIGIISRIHPPSAKEWQEGTRLITQ